MQAAIPVNLDIINKAQAVCDDMGLDISAVVNALLQQFVHTGGGDAFIGSITEKGKPVKYGGWEGTAWISDDFNAPLDDFEECI